MGHDRSLGLVRVLPIPNGWLNDIDALVSIVTGCLIGLDWLSISVTLKQVLVHPLRPGLALKGGPLLWREESQILQRMQRLMAHGQQRILLVHGDLDQALVVGATCPTACDGLLDLQGDIV